MVFCSFFIVGFLGESFLCVCIVWGLSWDGCWWSP